MGLYVCIYILFYESTDCTLSELNLLSVQKYTHFFSMNKNITQISIYLYKLDVRKGH